MTTPTSSKARLRLKEAVELAASSVGPAQKPKRYGNTAWDMGGKEHDLGELRERRNAAVRRGLRKMFKFFRRDGFSALHELGDDAPSIFFECWYTSANSAIRTEARAMCKALMPVFEAKLLLDTGGTPPPLPPQLTGGGKGSRSRTRLDAPIASAPAAQRRPSKDGASLPSRSRTRLVAAVAAANGGRKGGRRGGGGSGDAGSSAPSGEEAAGPVKPVAPIVSAAELDGPVKPLPPGAAASAAPATRAEKGGALGLVAAAAAAATAAAAIDADGDDSDGDGDGNNGGGSSNAGANADTAAADAPRRAKRRGARRARPSSSSTDADGSRPTAGGRASSECERSRPDRDDFFAFMFLARCKHEMGEETGLLLERADFAWRENGFGVTDELFGVRCAELGKVSVEDWLMLLMRIMIMEYNQILLGRRYRLQWGLKEALSALRSVPLTPPPRADEDFSNAFHHSFYLATHIVYVQSAYNAIKASEREIPWLYRYVRSSFRFWMRQARAHAADPSVYVDIDGVAEVCDCLRGVGLTEASDPMLCEGTLYLLNTQRKNGTWRAVLPNDTTPEKSLDAYHRIHPTWVCTQALRDRDFRVADNQFWPEFIGKVLKASKFDTLMYKPGW